MAAEIDALRIEWARIRALPPHAREEALAPLEEIEVGGISALEWLAYDWPLRAKPHQQPIPADTRWRFLFDCAGRGGGKSRNGAEGVRAAVEANDVGGHVALIGPTYGDVHDVMVEGESGILAVSPPWCRPQWSPSKGKAGQLRWSIGDGIIGHCYTAEKPDGVRGPQFGYAWGDEIGVWGTKGEEVDELLDPALRLGRMPRCHYTSTPRVTALVERLDRLARQEEAEVAAGKRHPNNRRYLMRRWSTLENAANLPPSTLASLLDRYAGTSRGRQELEGMLILDDPLSLWATSLIDQHSVSVDEVPELLRIVVAVDTALEESLTAEHGRTLDERNKARGPADTAIIIAGLGVDGHGYPLDDRTKIGASPDVWGRRVIEAWQHAWTSDDGEPRSADRIVIERNGGGAMIDKVLRSVASEMGIDPRTLPITWVKAKEGKVTRAEPVHARYEQGRVHHVRRPRRIVGSVDPLADLEYQMTRFRAGQVRRPQYKCDRVDALVYALTELLLTPRKSKAAVGRRWQSLT